MFTYEAPTPARSSQIDAAGFVVVVLTNAHPDDDAGAGTFAGRTMVSDVDRFLTVLES